MTSCTNRCMTMKVAGCFQFAEDRITISLLCGEKQVVREKRSCTLTLRARCQVAGRSRGARCRRILKAK